MTTETEFPATLPADDTLRTPRRLIDRAAAVLLFSCALVSVVTTVGIVLVLIVETAGFFREVSLGEFFGDTQWTPLFAQKRFGIWALVSGTVLTSAIAVCTAVPLGLIAAAYLSEFANGRIRKVLKPIMEILAGIPTVVYGYFALTFVNLVLQTIITRLDSLKKLEYM